MTKSVVLLFTHKKHCTIKYTQASTFTYYFYTTIPLIFRQISVFLHTETK